MSNTCLFNQGNTVEWRLVVAMVAAMLLAKILQSKTAIERKFMNLSKLYYFIIYYFGLANTHKQRPGVELKKNQSCANCKNMLDVEHMLKKQPVVFKQHYFWHIGLLDQFKLSICKSKLPR